MFKEFHTLKLVLSTLSLTKIFIINLNKFLKDLCPQRVNVADVLLVLQLLPCCCCTAASVRPFNRWRPHSPPLAPVKFAAPGELMTPLICSKCLGWKPFPFRFVFKVIAIVFVFVIAAGRHAKIKRKGLPTENPGNTAEKSIYQCTCDQKGEIIKHLLMNIVVGSKIHSKVTTE